MRDINPMTKVLIFLALIALFAMGQTSVQQRSIQPVYSATPGSPWLTLGSLTDSNSTPTVSSGGSAYATLTGLTPVGMLHFKIPDESGALKFRFETNADADATVIEIWVCQNQYMYTMSPSFRRTATRDTFTLGAILTLTGGTMTGLHSNKFVDTISTAGTAGILGTGTVRDSATNRYAIWECDFRGIKDVVIIATTLQASSTLYVEACWY